MKAILPKILVVFIFLVILLNLAFLGYGIHLYTSLDAGTILNTEVGMPFAISMITIDCVTILTIVFYFLIKKRF